MSESNAEAKAIFLEALDFEKTEDVIRFVDQACGVDSAKRAWVQQLLLAHKNAGNFLGRANPSAVASGEPMTEERPGALIGPYKLLEQIGEGGFGVVFMAEQQQPVRRKVALKVIKPGMDSRQVVARFEAERQALALMDHPNIAHVFDGGETATGRPYFVMELVRGIPITEFCDQNRLPVRERLELFIDLCQAVQHAHQKGIIHRDLKPNNVLVTLHDDMAVVKVIDFGVAKATGQQLTEKTLFTNFAQMLGTPLYMSPEQAQMSGLDMDTRSDVFSLGVLLYELLTGTTPFDKERLHTVSYDEMRRIIREEDPPRPSIRIGTSAATPTMMPAPSGTDPKRLGQLFRSELDWIVMKAIEKDRNRRYDTASAFATDLQRYLQDEAVLACPPSAVYTLRKLVRRNKGKVLAAGLLMIALLVGIVGTTFGMIRATHAEAEAVHLAKQKEDALEEKELALSVAQRSKLDADKTLFESYLTQARASRLSRRSGQRFESLEVLQRANDLARALELPADKFHDLRNAVVASLGLPDLLLTGPWIPLPADAFAAWDSDEEHTIVARTDRRGDCSIRRTVDDAELHHLPGLDSRALPLFSRDGKYIAIAHWVKVETGATGIAVRLWSLEQPTARLIWTEKNARQVDFHRDGHSVALAYNDGSIRSFELPSGRQLGSALAPSTITSEIAIALHPTEPLVAVCSYFGRVVQIRDVRTGNVVASLPQTGGANHVAWHPDGQTLAVGHAHPPLILLYDRTTLKPYRTMEAAAASLTFNHAGNRLAAHGWDGTMRLFDIGTGQKLFGADGTALRFSRDDRRLAGGFQDEKLGFWQVGDSREFRALVCKSLPEKGQYQAVALHPGGRLLAAGMSHGFGLWDLATGSELAFMPMNQGNEGGVMDLCFEPSGALLTAGLSGLLRWPVRADPKSPDRLKVGPPQLLLPKASSVRQSHDGRVTVASNRAVGGWQAYAGGWILHADRPNQPIRFGAGADIFSIAVDPEGRWIATVTFLSGHVKIWDARDGRLVKHLAEYGPCYPARFSPDGHWLSTAVDGGRLFAVNTWEAGPQVGVRSVFAPDSRLMAIQPSTGAGRLVDRTTGRELVRLEDPDFHRNSWHLFTPDGGKLFGLNSDKGICVWDLRLIRQQLKPMGLDWDYPEVSPTDSKQSVDRPPTVEIDTGYLASVARKREPNVRKTLEQYRLEVEEKPDDAVACNALAWIYLTAPLKLRDVKSALSLAENAVRLTPGEHNFRNTLGVAYYRAGRYREAVEMLRSNLDKQADNILAVDLYFLAMSHHQLGETDRARDFLAMAIRWTKAHPDLDLEQRKEMTQFRAEAEALLEAKNGS